MRNPSVSVVIPTFERREQVGEAVASVLAQTRPDFELIVVDDGSTDGTEGALAGVDPRLRYLRQEHAGVAPARNRGIDAATGEIVAFLDSDNLWLPDHLAVVTELLARHPEAVAVSTCPRFELNGRAPLDEARVVDLLPRHTLGTPVGYVSCVAVRRTELVAVGGFDEELEVWEDSDLLLRLAMRGPFCVLGRRTIVHRNGSEGLRRRGIRSGAYLRAMELSSVKAERTLRRLDRPDVPELLDHIRAKIRLVEGIRSTIDGREDAAKDAFAEVCRLAPELSDRPGTVFGNLVHAIVEGRSLADLTAATASAWPDRRSDTARFLALATGLLALRSGRAREAMTWLPHAELVRDPALLVRRRRLTKRLLREWILRRPVGAR